MFPSLPSHSLAVDKTSNGASHNLKAQIGAFHAASKVKEIFKWPKYNCTYAIYMYACKIEMCICKCECEYECGVCGCLCELVGVDVLLTIQRPCRACPRNCRFPAARRCADALACDILWLRV